MVVLQASFEWLLDTLPFVAVALIFLKALHIMGVEALHDLHTFMHKHHKGLLMLTAAIVLLTALLILPKLSH